MMWKPQVWRAGKCWHASNATGCFGSWRAAVAAAIREVGRAAREVPC